MSVKKIGKILKNRHKGSTSFPLFTNVQVFKFVFTLLFAIRNTRSLTFFIIINNLFYIGNYINIFYKIFMLQQRY